MILKNAGYQELFETVKERNNHLIIYGAGMIGQVVVPYWIRKYHMERYVKYFVDADRHKQGGIIRIGHYEIPVLSPDILQKIDDTVVLLITVSKFYPVIEFLDNLQALTKTEGYLVPIMQMERCSLSIPPSIVRLTDTPIIPKIIHYCWFSSKQMPKFLQECVKTWKELCPEYEILCWTEDNYPLEKVPYMKEAYECQKYGFVSDVARLDILYQYGGVYMDTDVTLIKKLDPLLYQKGFVGVEKWGNINTGGCVGAIPAHPMIKEMLEYRKKFHFILEDKSLNTESNGIYETIPFLKYGMRVDNTMQIIRDMTIYPHSVFHPYDYVSEEKKIEDHTFSIHNFYGGWMETRTLAERRITQTKYQDIIDRMKKNEL